MGSLCSAWQFLFGSMLQKVLYHLHSTCSVCALPLGSLLLATWLGLWHSPATSLLQGHPVTDHMFFSSDPQAGLYPKPWDNTASVPHFSQPPLPPPPREGISQGGEKNLVTDL